MKVHLVLTDRKCSASAYDVSFPDENTMGKDLRTQAVDLRLHRVPKLQADAWNLTHVQPFIPPLEQLFKTERLSSMAEYGIRLPEEVESVVDATHIKTTKGQTCEVHRKTTMILSPFKTMKGEYSAPGLPKPIETEKSYSEQMQSPYTAAYVGALASTLLSTSECPHFPRVYGTYAALSSNHEINISDDYEDLCDRKWFMDNIGKTFELRLRAANGTGFTHTRGQRAAVQVGDDLELDIEDVEVQHVDEPESFGLVEEYDLPSDSDESYETESDEEDAFEINSCDCSDFEDDEEESSIPSEEDDEDFAWATFSNVPVVTTVMESCKGTFYDLLKTSSDPQHHTAWVAQVVFALAYAQRTFGFIHNDLHGNNVMYVPTSEEFMFYRHHGVTYRVPTYGILIKIIDFDRAAFSVRISGMKEPRFFLSSQFKTDEEAGGQYNLEPFYTSTFPRIPLNPSFDLARFTASVFWDIFPEGPAQKSDHPLFELFKHWTTLPDGTSVIFREKGDNHDRFHGFDLYKAITRYLKDSAVPKKELSKFSQYCMTTAPSPTVTNILVIGD